MSYQRVIPRDFFNESKLLKCLGIVEIMVNHGRNPLGLETVYDDGPFDIQQNESDGSLFVSNFRLFHKGEEIRLFSPYNSKENWPLMAEWRGETYYVFSKDGEWILQI